VHSSGYHDHLFAEFLILRVAEVGDSEKRHLQAAKRGREGGSLNDLHLVGVARWVVEVFLLTGELVSEFVLSFLDLLGEVGEHAERVGQGVGKEHLVVIVLESVVPPQLEVDASVEFELVFTHQLAYPVLYVSPSESPASPCFLGLLETQDLYGHALLVERVPLGHVDYVEASGGALQFVFYAEEEPLEVPHSVGVRSQVHVVSVHLAVSHDQVEIARFEVRVEAQELPLFSGLGQLVRRLALGVHAYEVVGVVVRSGDLARPEDLFE